MKENNLKNYSKYSSEELMNKAFSVLNIKDENEELSKRIKLYSQELMLFNKSFNLVNFKDEKDLMLSHILVSLSAWSYFYNELNTFYEDDKNKERPFIIADVGSGAGFPGIPLSSLFSLPDYSFPNLQFKLVERMERRCNFLQNEKALLRLSNTEIINTELEQIPENSFDILTCRAFRTLDEKILNALLSATKKNGKLFLYKATDKKIKEDLEIVKAYALNFKIEKLKKIEPNKERNLLIIEKN